MQKNAGPIKLAWQSKSARSAIWIIFAICFGLSLLLTNILSGENFRKQNDNAINSMRLLSQTVSSAGDEDDDILLKVNDLINVRAIIGVRLTQGGSNPLLVGTIATDWPPLDSSQKEHVRWSDTKKHIEYAVRLGPEQPYHWIVLRADAGVVPAKSIWDNNLSWLLPFALAVIISVLALWAIGQKFLIPLNKINLFFQDHQGKYAASSLDANLELPKGEAAILAKQIEAMRTELTSARDKIEYQARFLQETPFPLLRCSVNRKILYANSAARNQPELFGDDSKEFVSPAVSELVRRAFQESKQVYGEIRCRNFIMTFRVIPLLDTGYVNLYGEGAKPLDTNA